jgi:hypothetical protein
MSVSPWRPPTGLPRFDLDHQLDRTIVIAAQCGDCARRGPRFGHGTKDA